jgi:hypothetical protein
VVAVILGVSVVGVLMWGLIDRKSLRALSMSTRIGLFTYLLALVAFSIGQFLTGQNEVVEISEIIGIILAVYTVFVVFNGGANQINRTNTGNIGRKFWKSILGAVLFGVLEAILVALPLAVDIKNYGLVIVALIAGLFGVFAIATIIVLLFKMLFGRDEDDD